MRWHENNKPQPNSGDRRTVRRFLIFPKEMGGEWRWLEMASWTQRYEPRFYEDYTHWGWRNKPDEGWQNP
jgi:hypothetical protein